MNFFKPFYLPLLFILSLSVKSQQNVSFSGSVSDARSNPVQGAVIHVLNTNLTTFSDEQGRFIFKEVLPGKYPLQVYATGYAAITPTVDIGLQSPDTTTAFVLKESSKQLDEVLISSQKNEETLQAVPISISTLSAKKIKEYALWNTKELTAVVPNLYAANPGDERNVTSIRGVISSSYDPAVSTYVDGVNQFSLDTYIAQLSDVERIEVLRGPQGTLYGRNAMGGVINILTKQPANTFSGSLEAVTGNYGQLRVNPALRFPLIKDRLFVGISSIFSKRDGYYTNSYNNTSFDDQHTFSNNLYLKFLASKKWVLSLNAKHQQFNNKGAFPLVNDRDEALGNPFILNQNAVARMLDKIFNISLSLNYTGDRFNLTNQAAYQYNHRYYDKPIDGDFSPIDAISILNNYGGKWNRVKVFTNELRLTSPANGTGKLKWVAGSYFFHQENPSKQGLHYGNDAGMIGSPATNFTSINSTKANGYGIAAFGQVTYLILPKLNIIAGIRYDYEEKKYTVMGEYASDSDPGNLIVTVPDTIGKASFRAFSPKLGLSYEVDSNKTAFLTYSRGYRAGGLTSLSSDPSAPPLYAFKPEFSQNIELGLKNKLLNNRMQLNLAFFLTKVTDIQVPSLVYPDAITVTKNAGSLTSKGVEVEVSAKPFNGLQIDYNFGYTDAEFGNLEYAQYGTSVNLKGNRQVFTPKTTSMLALQYEYKFRETYKISIRGEWRNLGEQYFDVGNMIRQGNYSIFNNALTVSYRQTSLSFWMKNFLDKKYISYAYDFGAIHLGDPKTFGLTLLTSF